MKKITLSILTYGLLSIPVITYGANLSDSLTTKKVKFKTSKLLKPNFLLSTSSYWYGAEARYNFIGNGDFENFIGAAQVIWAQKPFGNKWELNGIGNIADVGKKSVKMKKSISPK